MSMLIDSSSAAPLTFDHLLVEGGRLVIYGDDLHKIETFLTRCKETKFAFNSQSTFCWFGTYHGLGATKMHDSMNLQHTAWAKNALGSVAPAGFGVVNYVMGLVSGKVFVGVNASKDFQPAQLKFVVNQDDLQPAGGFINSGWPSGKGSFTLAEVQQQLEVSRAGKKK